MRLILARSDSLRPLDDASRDAINQGAMNRAGATKAEGIVIPSEGFGSALVRAIITGMVLFQRVNYPSTVFAGVDEAARWSAQKMASVDGRPVAVEEILAVVRAVESAPVSSETIRSVD